MPGFNCSHHLQTFFGFLAVSASILAGVSLRKLIKQRHTLRKSRDEHRILIDNISIQIWCLSDPYTYGAVNRAHADFNGRRPEELAYRHLTDIYEPDLAKLWMSANERLFSTGIPIATEEWRADSSGDMRLLSVYKAPVFNNDGSVAYLVCSAEDITDKKNAEEELSRIALAVELARARSVIESQERARFARELHDGLGQTLQAARLQLKLMQRRHQKGRCLTDLETITHDIEVASEELREITHSIHHSLLIEQTLHQALARHCARLVSRGIPIKTFISEDIPELQLHLKEHLFRIAQEAIGNSVRHSNATEIEVLLRGDFTKVLLTVYDNGRGFDADNISVTGVGLQSIAERAMLIEATLNISSGSSGTTISIEVPINDTHSDC